MTSLSRVRLHVNIDHVATLRQQRETLYPDPVAAAALCELAGADGITVHLREDRRHIQDRDVRLLRQTVRTLLNLEMAATDEMVAIAASVRPEVVTLVPEKRAERTTEGGLDVAGSAGVATREAIAALRPLGIDVSLFIDPSEEAVLAAVAVGATHIELHTGDYCDAPREQRGAELSRLVSAAQLAERRGLHVAGGHGLDYANVLSVVEIPQIVELNIGHAIVSRAVLVGLDRAVRDMRELLARSTAGALLQ
jgi:pyridoxine 5-phosphate synthase